MLRLLSLDLEQIGPFERAHIDFAAENEPLVTIITGENGTGKSIVLDAIRSAFGGFFADVGRNIERSKQHSIRLALTRKDEERGLLRETLEDTIKQQKIKTYPPRLQAGAAAAENWLVDFWGPVGAVDSFKIPSLLSMEHKGFLVGALQGKASNASLTQLLAHFDYLRSSDIERERKAGERLFLMAKKIASFSLLDGGELVGIRRADFTPIIRQAGAEVPIENLSSGNAYLIQRLISLLGKMYSVHVLRQTPPEEIGLTPGILLIDEAENHLHPRWQKKFLRGILDLFPNLQIIAATHSPFIVASVPGARVYVCKYDRERQACFIEEQREDVSNRPVDEILLSGVFDETQPFNAEITALIAARRAAIEQGNQAAQEAAERRLLAINPQHFSYFEVEKMLASMEKAS